jgi:hypothetical protein
MELLDKKGPWKDAWQALVFVAAAGGLALAFVGIGVWIVRRIGAGEAPVPLRLTPAAGLDGFGNVQLRRSDAVHDGFRIITIPVGNTPARIVGTSAGDPRSVVISTDQPIRVLETSEVSSERGFYVPANIPYTVPHGVGPNDELWAVRAGDANATVSISVRRHLFR